MKKFTTTTKTPISFLIIFFLMIFSGSVFAAEKTDVITDFSDLKTAIHSAKDGDILYVGDIDFSPSGDIANSEMRIEIEKDITIKSGKPGEKAVLTNGSFVLSGGKASEGKKTFHFEDIIFDGGIDTFELKTTDFDYPWSEEEQAYILLEPRKAQYALSFKGNVDASFSGCDFQNYMHEYGPIMQVRYGDYTAIPSLLEMFGDYSGCSLRIDFENCNIKNNAAFYDGGAIFIEGCNNVSFAAKNCVFQDNYSGEGSFRIGGGAMYVSGAKVSLQHCRMENNSANYLFPDMELPDEDRNQGGGLYAESCRLDIADSRIIGNSASLGGGLALINTNAIIDGCVLAGNRAEEHSTNWTGDTGPWNNMAQGGAIYHSGNTGTKVTVLNSDIYKNSAQNAYGGVYSHYSGVESEVGAGQLELLLCNYYENACDSKYDYSDPDKFMWCSHPGDILEIPTIKTAGCVLIDDSFASDFPHSELPSEENAYNYVVSPQKADSDGLKISYLQNDHLTVSVPKGINFSIPKEYVKGFFGEDQEKRIKKVHVGSNYEEALYSEKRGSNIVFCIAAALIVLAGVWIIKCKNTQTDNDTSNKSSFPENTSETIIVKAWFTKDEIDRIMTSLSKSQTLTRREKEVFMEILEGKKQKEIAYDLGIETTTVKDFYRKIYDKLGFANKEELLRECSKLLK